MTRRPTGSSKSADNPLPTYLELADLVAELTEHSIANLDGSGRFVTCYTYGPGVMPPHWQRAIDAREALIANKAVPRKNAKKDAAR